MLNYSNEQLQLPSNSFRCTFTIKSQNNLSSSSSTGIEIIVIGDDFSTKAVAEQNASWKMLLNEEFNRIYGKVDAQLLNKPTLNSGKNNTVTSYNENNIINNNIISNNNIINNNNDNNSNINNNNNNNNNKIITNNNNS